MAEHLMPQQQHSLMNNLVDGQRRHRWLALLRERPNPLDDLGCPIAVVDYALHGAAHLVQVRHVAREPAQAGAAIGDDGGERLIDLMRDRSRQLSQARDTSHMRELCPHIAQRLLSLICADRRGDIGSDAPITEKLAFCVKEWLSARSQVNRGTIAPYGAVHKI